MVIFAGFLHFYVKFLSFEFDPKIERIKEPKLKKPLQRRREEEITKGMLRDFVSTGSKIARSNVESHNFELMSNPNSEAPY